MSDFSEAIARVWEGVDPDQPLVKEAVSADLIGNVVKRINPNAQHKLVRGMTPDARITALGARADHRAEWLKRKANSLADAGNIEKAQEYRRRSAASAGQSDHFLGAMDKWSKSELGGVRKITNATERVPSNSYRGYDPAASSAVKSPAPARPKRTDTEIVKQMTPAQPRPNQVAGTVPDGGRRAPAPAPAKGTVPDGRKAPAADPFDRTALSVADGSGAVAPPRSTIPDRPLASAAPVSAPAPSPVVPPQPAPVSAGARATPTPATQPSAAAAPNPVQPPPQMDPLTKTTPGLGPQQQVASAAGDGMAAAPAQSAAAVQPPPAATAPAATAPAPAAAPAPNVHYDNSGMGALQGAGEAIGRPNDRGFIDSSLRNANIRTSNNAATPAGGNTVVNDVVHGTDGSSRAVVRPREQMGAGTTTHAVDGSRTDFSISDPQTYGNWQSAIPEAYKDTFAGLAQTDLSGVLSKLQETGANPQLQGVLEQFLSAGAAPAASGLGLGLGGMLGVGGLGLGAGALGMSALRGRGQPQPQPQYQDY